MSEPERQLAGVEKQRARANRYDARDEEELAEFAHRIH
jgi:hypothetical protein